jgi:probable rRNA maturation factor
MPTQEISISFRHPSRRVLRRPLREFLAETARLVMPGRGVACLITDDRELRALNRRFLRKDYATDVLSFAAAKELASTTGPTSSKARSAEARRTPRRLKGQAGPARASNGEPGEMAISLDRAADQAARFGHSVEDELRILMLHGLLHLAGMDHESDAGQMARAEARWRKRLKLPPGLVERARA